MSSQNRGPRVKEAPEMDKDWEDEYRRLYEKHGELKLLCSQQDDHIKKLQTKVRKLESDFVQLERNSTKGSAKTPIDKEEENVINALKEQNLKLTGINSNLVEKNKQLNEVLEKRKREISVLKGLQKSRPKSAGSISAKENIGEIEIRGAPNPSGPLVGTKRTSSEANVAPPVSSNTDSNLLEIARKYKAKLSAAEEQLAVLQNENQKLRIATSKGSVAPAPPSMNMTASFTKGNNSELESQLRDSNWRLQQLQTQYDYLVSKSSANNQNAKYSEDQVEDYSKKVRDLRRILEELRHEKDISDAKAARVEELEETTRELRHANRSLEDKISRLCEAPFISDAFGKHENQMRYEDASKEKDDLKAKVSHLQEAVRSHFSALTTLQQQAAQCAKEKDDALRKCEEMRLKYEEVESNASVLKDKLKLYSGDDDIDLESLERALTLVKRRSEAMGKLPFLEDPDGNNLVTLPLVKRKLEEVQVINLKLTEEVERLENMLKLQSGINRDLHKELESMVHKRDKDNRELVQRSEDFEELALRRLEKIHALEAQIRELIYGVSGKKTHKIVDHNPTQRGAKKDVVVADPEPDNPLLSDLIDEKGGEITPDENLLEIWVKSATLRDGVLGPGSSSFVVIDFFDYESQASALISGTKPQWDFAATFKIVVDDFLLRYLATDVVTFEYNIACQGDFSLLARASIPLSQLLRSNPIVKINNHPMISVSTGAVVAYLNIEMRLALPVSEMYKLFLERHPSERKQIEDISSQRVLDAHEALEKAKSFEGGLSKNDSESRLYNELELVILKATDLPMSKDGTAPAAYVHFQLLGNPDKFTNPVPNSNSPNFNERFLFPMVTNDQQIRLLQRSKLQLNVIDMKGEDDEDGEGFIGEVFVSLSEIAEGAPLVDVFSIKDKDGKKAAEIQISLRWKFPFKNQRDTGPQSLGAIEVETLISSFSLGEINEGIVDYKAFCRFIDPPHDVRRVMDKLRALARQISEKENRTSRDIFKLLLDDVSSIAEDYFVEKMLLTQIDALPVDFARLFRFVDMDDDNRVSLDQFLAVLNLDEVSGVPAGLQDKLRERVRDLESRNISVVRIFEDADQWGTKGCVSRMEFKGALKRMGFNLIDEPEPVSVSSAMEKLMKKQVEPRLLDDDLNESMGGILNDTMGSNDEVLIAQDGEAPGRGRDSGRDRAEFNKQQRELFEERKNEMIQRSQQAAAQQQKIEEAKSKLIPPTLSVDPFDGSKEHRSGFVSKGYTVNTSDKEALDQAATKLQSSFRGFKTRTSKEDLRDSSAPPKATTSKNSASQLAVSIADENSNKIADILTAEHTIRQSLASLDGVRSQPNILGGFQTVDTKRLGYVNRAQFAHVMQQFPQIKLYGGELRACMDFFDKSNDGSQIDYTAFTKFAKFTPPEVIPAMEKLQSLVFSPSAILKFRAHDTVGTGHIKRADMLRTLADMGHGNISQSTMLSILELFETRVDGQVNYSNFVEYIRENELSVALDAVSKALHTLVSNGEDGRSWFKKVDRDGNGSFNLQQFSTFLENFEIKAPKRIISALFASMNREGYGVHVNDFMSWIKSYPEEYKNVYSFYNNLTIAELQRKAHKYMLAVASIGSQKLEEIGSTYLMYDWNKPAAGVINKSLFSKATKYAGFPFTTGELRMLAAEFGSRDSSGKVSYRKFLSWSTPSEEAGLGIIANVTEVGAPLGKKSASAMTKFLEKALQRGADLLSIFGRYDNSSSGRISADDFCSGLADLGLSSATKNEALDLADKYKAAVGDFVLYRRIVTELLHQVDEAVGAADIDIIDTIRNIMMRGKVEPRRLRDMFEYYDRQGTGRVKEEDLGTIFDEVGARLKRQEIDQIADRFASGGSGWVHYLTLLSTLEDRLGIKSTSIKKLAISDDLAAKMRGFFEGLVLRGKDFRTEFDKFDDNFSGTIRQSDFRDVLQERLRCGLASKELDTLEKVYKDSSDPRRVNHVKLILDLHPSRQGLEDGVYNHDTNQIWEVAEDLRQKIRRRCDYMSPSELRRPYRHFCRKKGDGGVGLDDFTSAIQSLGLRLASDQVEALFNIININGGRAFHYTDFVIFVRDPQHQDVVWKLRRLMARARVSEKELLNGLNDLDTNSSGIVSNKQFSKVMALCNIELTDTDVARLMIRFDSEEVQHFDLDKFSRFLRGKSSSTNEEDHARDPKSTRSSLDALETQSWNSLKRRIEAKLESGFTKSEVFGIFDYEDKGTLDLMSLQQGARDIGVTLSRAEARSILRRMSILVGGAVDKKTFFEALEVDDVKRESRYRDSRDSERGGTEYDDDYDAPRRKRDDVVALVRSKIENSCDDRESPAESFQKALNKYNDDDITLRGVSRSLDYMNIKVSTSDLDKLMETLEKELGRSMTTKSVVSYLFKSSSKSSYDDDKKKSSSNNNSVKAAFRKRPDLFDEINRNLSKINEANRSTTATTLEDLKADFKRADSHRAGFLERRAFLKVLNEFGFRFKNEIDRDLVDTLGEGEPGIYYDKFIDAILDSDSDGIGSSNEVLSNLYKRMAKEFNNSNNTLDIDEVFSRKDRGRVDELPIEDFEDALYKKGVTLTAEELKNIQKEFGRGSYIKYKDFLKAFKAGSSLNRYSNSTKDNGELAEILDTIRRKILDYYGSDVQALRRTKETFIDLDKDDTNRVSKKDFIKALDLLHVELRTREVDMLVEKYEKYRDFIDAIGFKK